MLHLVPLFPSPHPPPPPQARGARLLAAGIRTAGSVRGLYLACNGMGDEGASHLAQVRRGGRIWGPHTWHRWGGFPILHPNPTSRTCHAASPLPLPLPLQAIVGNTSLVVVDLSGNGLGADTCMVLGEVSPTPTPVSREPTLDPAPTATTHWAHLSPFLFPPSGAA